jgi:hypothetical protein
MDNVELIEFAESELNAALGLLTRISEAEPAEARAHMTEAKRRYDNIMDALPKLMLSGKRRVDFLSKLAALRTRLMFGKEDT